LYGCTLVKYISNISSFEILDFVFAAASAVLKNLLNFESRYFNLAQLPMQSLIVKTQIAQIIQVKLPLRLLLMPTQNVEMTLIRIRTE